MKHKIFHAFLIPVALFVSHVHANSLSPEIMEHSKGCYRGAKTPALVVNHDNIGIKRSGDKPLTAKKLKEAIVQAAKKNRWSIESQGEEKLLATLNVRGKHTVAVEITYAPTQYSIHYKNSVNMNHVVCGGYAFIHPNYNKWVEQLKGAIQENLSEI